MTRFSQVALTDSNVMDQTGQSTFIPNIHPNKQYKNVLEHQKTPTFTMLMEAAAAHALTEDKMNLLLDLEP